MLRPERFLTLLAPVLAALAVAGPAQADSGRYVFDGGSRAQRAEVRAALEASSFDWNVVPGTVTIHIVRGRDSHATPGHVWLDADLLDAGRFAWAIVQHEYAHQVDFLALDGPARRRLRAELGGADWCYERHGLRHGQHGCERFASMLAWAYWPSRRNALRPRRGEQPAMPPVAFRRLLAELL